MDQRTQTNPKYLPDKLLAVRHKLGMSRSQLGKLLGLEKGAGRISDYERGVRCPDLIVVLNYAKLARLSFELLADDNLELKFPKNWKGPKHAQVL